MLISSWQLGDESVFRRVGNAGKLTAVTLRSSTGIVGTYTYDAADRLTAAGGSAYTFGNNGNQTARDSDSFAWGAEDRLTWATVSGTTTSFDYDGDGLRDSLTVEANTTTFTWDIAAGLPQVLDDGGFKYVYGFGRTAEVGPGATTHYYLADGLGSVMALVDGSGAVVNIYDYDVFGAVRSSTGSQANAFTFTGEQTDASTGLDYLRARYYDAGTGRFSGIDPLPGLVGLPLSQNAYVYVLGNPTNLLDPSGLCVFGAPCPKPIKKAGKAVSDLYRERKAAIQEQFRRDIAEIRELGKKIETFLVSDCGQFAVAVGQVGLSMMGPWGMAANVLISGGYFVRDVVKKEGAGMAVDLQSAYGNMAAVIDSMPGGVPTRLGSLAAGSSLISASYSGARCLGIFK